MTLVMDGVRRTQVMRPSGEAVVAPVPMAEVVVAPSPGTVVLPAAAEPAKPQRKRITAATTKAMAGVRYVTGMDGVRRPVRTAPAKTAAAPRPVAPAMRRPPAAMDAVGVMSPAAVLEATAEPAVRARPLQRLMGRGWQRPTIAFGLVATALVASGITVHALATPQTTAVRAEAPQVAATPAPTPAPTVASTPAPTPKQAALQRILDDFVAANGNSFGIVVKDLKTGETASINPDRQFKSASLYKLFVAQRIYQRIDLGQLGYGSPAGGGTGRTVESCLRIMINVSDNPCGRALGTILGWSSQDQALRLEGYKTTTLRTPQQTSAADVALMFNRLYDGTLVSADSSERFMALLKDQRVNNRLPKGLPHGTVIAHKTGDLDGVVHDAGIVYGPKTNYLVVMTSGPWSMPGNAQGMFADLSRKLWHHFEQ